MVERFPWESSVPVPAPVPELRLRGAAPTSAPPRSGTTLTPGDLPLDPLLNGMPDFGPAGPRRGETGASATPDMRGLVEWLEGKDDGAWLGAGRGVRFGRRPREGLLDLHDVPRWSGSTLTGMISGPGAPYGPVGATGFSDDLVGYLDRLTAASSAGEIDALVLDARDGHGGDLQPPEADILFRAGEARKRQLGGEMPDGPPAAVGVPYGAFSDLDDPMVQDFFTRIDAAGSDAELRDLRFEMQGLPPEFWGRISDALDHRAWQLRATLEDVILHGLPPWGIDPLEPQLLPSGDDLTILPRAGYGGWPFEIISVDTARGTTLTRDGLPGGIDVADIRRNPMPADGLLSAWTDDIFRDSYREFGFSPVSHAFLEPGRFGDLLALGASATDTAMLDIIMSEFPDAAWGRDANGNLIVVIDETPYYLNPPGLDDLDALRGLVANVPLIAAGGGLRAFGKWVGTGIGGLIGSIYHQDFGEKVSNRIRGVFDLFGDVVDIPYETLLDDLSIAHGSKIPRRHDDIWADILSSLARNYAKIKTGEALK